MNLDYKLFYLLFAENSDAGDPASCCSIRHFLSLESARTVMKEGFAAYQKACGGLDVEDDEHELTITDNEITVRSGIPSWGAAVFCCPQSALRHWHQIGTKLAKKFHRRKRLLQYKRTLITVSRELRN